MRQQKYMNVMLTVNAILLAALVWTQVADQPLLAGTAEAQVRTDPVEPRFPNAAQQRAEMTRALKALTSAVDAQTAYMKSGAMKVEVTNLSELLADNAP